MKASVFCIGTELVDGQIVNGNAPWISKKLKDRGLQTSLHLVVPDEQRLMQQGLALCARESDVIFVTGGLGPTSDDFTRDIVAEWMQKPLVFHEPSWVHLSERLSSRGYAVKEIQRQQCYFPEGAEVLVNSQGTANAFYVEHLDKKVFVLPGPPREIAAVWENHIQSWLELHTQHLDRAVTRMWDTLGLGESDIAVLVEDVLKDVDIEKGYRVHAPYVEVKLSYKKSLEPKNEIWVEKVTQALDPYTISRDGADIALLFVDALVAYPHVQIVDNITGSCLFKRLASTTFGAVMNTSNHRWIFSNTRQASNAEELVLEITSSQAFQAAITLEFRGKKVTEVIQSPYVTLNMHERSLQYFTERALTFWTSALRELMP